MKEENWGEAINDFNKSIEEYDGDENCFIWRGNAHYKNGNIEGAKADYQEALDLEPDLDRSDKDLFWYQPTEL
jgi:tetratricopeptide (TPR) repeat protein